VSSVTTKDAKLPEEAVLESPSVEVTVQESTVTPVAGP